MPSLITDSEIAWFTGASLSGFYTFCDAITIFKEPIKTVTTVNTDVLVGYGDSSVTTNITYTPVSGQFSGVVSYTKDFHADANFFTKTQPIFDGKVWIKFLQDGRDYIENGKTETLYFDDLYWTLTSPIRVKNYFGLKYYVYEATQVK